MYINTDREYYIYIKSLDWQNYNDFFDNVVDYESAFIIALQKEDPVSLKGIKDFYDKATMIDINIKQLVKTLPAIEYLINMHPYYLNAIIDILIENYRIRAKENGCFCSVSSMLFNFLPEYDNLIQFLKFKKIIRYFQNDSIIMQKKIIQLFSFLPDPTYLLNYKNFISPDLYIFYLFSLSISFKINKIDDLKNMYFYFNSSNNILINTISEFFFNIISKEKKLLLENEISKTWYKTNKITDIYWFLRDESIGYLSLIAFLDNYTNNENILFIKNLIINKFNNFEEEDYYYRLQYNLKNNKELSTYKRIIYSQHKINQINICLNYYNLKF